MKEDNMTIGIEVQKDGIVASIGFDALEAMLKACAKAKARKASAQLKNSIVQIEAGTFYTRQQLERATTKRAVWLR